MLEIRTSSRSFATGTSRVLLAHTDRLRPRRLTAPARVRSREVAHILAARFQAPVTAVALPPVGLRAATWLDAGQAGADGERWLALRAAVAATASSERELPAGLLAELQRRGLTAVARHVGGDGEAMTVLVGGAGFPRAVGGWLPGRLHVNTHFFVLEPVELGAPHAAIGDAVGMLAADGVVVRPPAVARATLVQTSAGWSVRRLGPDDLELRIGGEVVEGGRVVARGDADGRDERPALEVLLQGRWPLVASEERSLEVPHGALVARWEGRVPSAVRSALTAGRPFDYRLVGVPDLITAVQAGPELLRAGEVVVSEAGLAQEGLPSPTGPARSAPTAFPTDVDRTPAARVGVGVTSSGELLLAVVEGASSVAGTSATGSRGCTLVELAELLRDAGAVDALNLDGGGSVQAFLGGGALVTPADTRRQPGASFDRPVPVMASLG